VRPARASAAKKEDVGFMAEESVFSGARG